MKVSLRLMLSLALIVLTALPVIMLGVWVQQTTLEREYAKVEEKHLLLAKNITLALNRYALDIQSVFRLLSSIDGNQLILDDVAELADKLGFEAFRVENTNGDITGNRVLREDDSVTFPDEIIKAAWQTGDGKILVHPVTLSTPGNPKIFLSRKLNSDKLAVAAVRLDYIQEIQSMIKFGDSGHSAVVDHVGNLMAHPKKDWVNENRNISHLKPIESMIKGQSGVIEFFSPATKQDMITGYSVVPGVGWGVMIPQALSELRAAANAALRQLWSVLTLGIILTAIFAWWLAGWIISPLNRITHTANQMNKGDLGARVLPFVTVPADEFRELGVAFDQMAQSLQNNTALLQIKLEKQNLEKLQKANHLNSKGKILVVDDYPVNVLQATGWLSKAGYTTFSALTNEESLKIASVIQPDLAIVGVQSSLDGGLERKRKLITLLDGVSIPVIAILPQNASSEMVGEADLRVIAMKKRPVSESQLLDIVDDIQKASHWKNLNVQFT